MGRYAENTSVSVSNTQAEIERILTRYGADQFMRGWDSDKAVLIFRANGRQVRFILPMPSKKDFERTETGRYRKTQKSIDEAWEQGCRQRWRALALVVKAKLEAVAAGISTFEDEFLSNIMLPNGQSAGEWMKPQVAIAYETGTMPPLLPQSVERS